jgi:hypothetical protein
MNSWHAPRITSNDIVDNHFYLLTLYLELQLDLLVVAFRSDLLAGVRATPSNTVSSTGTAWPRWDGDTLDLTEEDSLRPLGEGEAAPSREWLATRYVALAEAIQEMLGNPEVQRHPAVVARLNEARSTCDERLAALAVRPEPEIVDPVTSLPVEAGHFLG